jgi:hypothetical protein
MSEQKVRVAQTIDSLRDQSVSLGCGVAAISGLAACMPSAAREFAALGTTWRRRECVRSGKAGSSPRTLSLRPVGGGEHPGYRDDTLARPQRPSRCYPPDLGAHGAWRRTQLGQSRTRDAAHLRSDQSHRPGTLRPTVIIESTIEPSWIDTVVLPQLHAEGLRPGIDVLVGAAPRRDWFSGANTHWKACPESWAATIARQPPC